jgi:hypothetical protein
MKLTDWQRMLIGQAINNLGEAVVESTREDGNAIGKVNSCIRNLNEFLGQSRPAPNLTEDEAEVARNLHTYMRKGMDCPLSVILYRMIDEDRAHNIWFSFVKELAATKSYSKAIRAAEKAADNGTTDDFILLSALGIWKDDFQDAMEWIGMKPLKKAPPLK